MAFSPPSFEQAFASISTIPGYLVPGQEKYLFDKVRSLPDGATVVEIGSLYGRSSATLASACAGSNRRLFCIDPWVHFDLGNLDFFHQWEANLESRGLLPCVTPLRGKSHDVLANWSELTNNRPIDFIFIDGWHEYGSILRDLQLAFPLVRDGGWIALHDVCPDWPGPMRVWNETAVPSLTRLEKCSTIGCGMKTAGVGLKDTPTPPAMTPGALQVHYFTEATNATALTDLLATFRLLRQLPFEWRWHVVGSAWVASRLAPLLREFAGRVTLHAPAHGEWKDRVAGLSAMHESIGQECLLWRLAAGETWTAGELIRGLRLFVENPTRTGALVENDGVAEPVAWHAHPWFAWSNAIAPALTATLADGTRLDVGRVRPFTVEEMRSAGIDRAAYRAVALAA